MIPVWLTNELRAITVVLAVWTLIRLGQARYTKWKTKYTPKEKASWTALFLTSLFFLEAPLENFFQDNKGGPRQILGILTMVAVLWVTYLEDDRRIVINTVEQENQE